VFVFYLDIYFSLHANLTALTLNLKAFGVFVFYLDIYFSLHANLTALTLNLKASDVTLNASHIKSTHIIVGFSRISF